MEPLLLRKIRKTLDGTLQLGSENWYVKHACIDNRHELSEPNSIIFLNKRNEVDWTTFNRLTPCAIITDKPKEEWEQAGPHITIITVKSVLQAEWKFIEYYRSLFNIPVVTITGTCGKSTTKEMIKQILSHDRTVQATESSKNEPRRSFAYLMGINRSTKAAVFETGLGNPGNIKHQCLIFRPTIGIITTIGAHHLDGCKTIEGYIQAKAEIVTGIEKGGTLIINGDDENIKQISLHGFEGNVITFSCKTPADFYAENIRFANHGMDFDVIHKNKRYPVFVPGYGEHQVYNAIAAIAAVESIGLSIPEAAKRLQSFRNMERHLDVTKGINGSTIIDDTWTINPTSIEAALKVMDEISKGKKKIVLLGNINRLGAYEKEFHQKMGTLVAQRNIHALITLGDKAEDIAKQAKKEQFKGNIHIFKKVDGLKELLLQYLDENTDLLIKGPMSSRSMIELAKSLKL